MTFTEAAVEVLRLVGKPLHYKKITEIAIERDLLSHLGKTPETTMSSRLATMVRKDRGDAPIIKVKPGVFGLREFSSDVLEKARHESGHEYELVEPEEPRAEAQAEEDAPSAPKRPVPGADIFPEEDDDDDLILAKLDEEEEEPKKRSKRRRRRKKKDEDGESRDGSRGDRERDRDRDRERGRRGRRDRDRDRSRGKKELEGDWERSTQDQEPAGRDLADAIEIAVGGRRTPKSLAVVAEALVKKGRLHGDPSALVPTIAAAVRGDAARRRDDGVPPRFLLDGDQLSLAEWWLPTEAVRAQHDALKSAARQRDLVRRVFLRRLQRLPAAGLLELLATWLNAEGVVGLRGVRRPDARPNEFHLAGTLRRGPESIPLALHVVRDASLTREKVVEIRGSLHHYGDARVAWLVSLGGVLRGAEEEAATVGSAPVALFGGSRLSEAMELAGVGLRRAPAPLAYLDLELLDALQGPGRSEPVIEEDEDEDEEGKRGRRRRRRRRRRKDRDEDASELHDESNDEGATETETSNEEATEETSSEPNDETTETEPETDSESDEDEIQPLSQSEIDLAAAPRSEEE
ncbi:MAG: winged helix-turn-helix domain-containing protein [Myxococcota bacterium]